MDVITSCHFCMWHIAIQLVFVSLAVGLQNGLARTPVMGWLAWERFKCTVDCNEAKDNCISENLFIAMADHLIKDGYKDVGYNYVNIDDCWMSKRRNRYGQLTADPKRFPRGIKFLADYMHSRGLKLGIYEDFGKYTCMGFPGVIGHMEQDAAMFAKWEVDMVKLDGCNSQPEDMDSGYTKFGYLLNSTERPMVYSCSWPYYQLHNKMQPKYKDIAEHCNMWRIYEDIVDSWESIQQIMDFFGDNQEVLTQFVGPGHWSDPDMLVIGNYHLTVSQSEIHMAVWAILAAPLLMSNDLRSIGPEFRNILLNRKVIAIDQDELGIPGKRIYKSDDIEIWKRPVTPVQGEEFSYALLLVNRRSKQVEVGGHIKVRFRLEQFGMRSPGGYFVEELFGKASYGHLSSRQAIKVQLPSESCIFLKAVIIS